jgi:hypothetical protein
MTVEFSRPRPPTNSRCLVLARRRDDGSRPRRSSRASAQPWRDAADGDGCLVSNVHSDLSRVQDSRNSGTAYGRLLTRIARCSCEPDQYPNRRRSSGWRTSTRKLTGEHLRAEGRTDVPQPVRRESSSPPHRERTGLAAVVELSGFVRTPMPAQGDRAQRSLSLVSLEALSS